MNVCNQEEEVVSYKRGNLYQWKKSSDVYMALSETALVHLQTGVLYEDQRRTKWTKDVTDSYCLQKVK